VQEVFTEVDVPLLADLPFMKRLSFNGSFRWTDYDSYGSDTTYKAGLNWQVLDSVRLRGAYGTSFRAPALYELFLANQTSFTNQTAIDPCINWAQSSNQFIQRNCAAAGVPGDYTAAGSSSATVVAGGGKGVLEAETSNNSTIGLIWTPESLPVSAAVDWWRIEVENQVAQFGASSIVSACYTSENYPNEPFCQLFTRDNNPASLRFRQITEVRNSYVNISNQIVEGTDWTFRFDKRFGKTRFTANALVTYFYVDSSQLFRTSAPQNVRGWVYNNKWVASLDLRFERGPWTLNWNIDAFSATTNDIRFGGNVFGGVGLPNCATVSTAQAPYCVSALYEQSTDQHLQHDVSIRYRADKWEAIVGVANVFDKDPPLLSVTGATRIGNAIAISNYDTLGRRVFGTLSYRF
jgi:iron complex outermembrane receptor protein